MTKQSEEGKPVDSSMQRRLELFDSSMMMMGIVIGSGIFMTSGLIAQALPSAILILMCWLVGGTLTLMGASIYAELGAAMPEAGGQYVYLREAYGPLPAFLFGWLMTLVYVSGSIAGLAVAFSEYLGYFLPSISSENIVFSTQFQQGDFHVTLSLTTAQIIAVFLIFILSAVNYLGVIFGKIVQNVFTVIKIGGILAFILLGLTIGSTITIDFSLNPTGLSVSQLITGFGVALVAVSWTFDGWSNVNFICGEIKNPGRNLPRALILGTLAITFLYLLVNYVYLSVLPISEMAGDVTIAESAVRSMFGDAAIGLFSAMVLVSIFGSLNGNIFTGARVTYKTAKDGYFFKKAGNLHPRFLTPAFAIIIQGTWAVVLTLSGSFEQLMTYVIVGAMIFWIAGAASVFTLRRKYPNLYRPYKTLGYPYTPAIFILATAGILINTLFANPLETILGMVIILTGLPAFYYWKKKRKTETIGRN
jgi:APA family basic amino acid/polyamine antiporter